MPARPPRLSCLVAVALCGAAIVGCASTPTPTRASVIAALRASGFAPAEARCATDRLFADLTPAELRAIATRGASAVPSAKSSKVSGELSACAAASSTSPLGSGTVPSTVTTVPGPTAGPASSVPPAGSGGSTSTTSPASTSSRRVPSSTGRAR